jgi:hypothetical protein
VRDFIAALDGATGKVVWRKYVIPAPGELFSPRTATVWVGLPESELARHVKEMNFLSAHRSSSALRPGREQGLDRSDAHRVHIRITIHIRPGGWLRRGARRLDGDREQPQKPLGDACSCLAHLARHIAVFEKTERRLVAGAPFLQTSGCLSPGRNLSRSYRRQGSHTGLTHRCRTWT